MSNMFLGQVDAADTGPELRDLLGLFSTNGFLSTHSKYIFITSMVGALIMYLDVYGVIRGL